MSWKKEDDHSEDRINGEKFRMTRELTVTISRNDHLEDSTSKSIGGRQSRVYVQAAH